MKTYTNIFRSTMAHQFTNAFYGKVAGASFVVRSREDWLGWHPHQCCSD